MKQLKQIDVILETLTPKIRTYKTQVEKTEKDKLELLEQEEGSKKIAVTLENDDFALIQTLWDGITNFKASKDQREIVLGINDGLQNTQEVKKNG